nr:reverse transcriptase domain-containing protein [Tanacetum cinerariifolium]
MSLDLAFEHSSQSRSTRNLFPPLDNPELTIRKRPRVDPTLLNDFNMATNRNGDDITPPEGGDLPVSDLRTMEELCQPTLNGRGGTVSFVTSVLHSTTLGGEYVVGIVCPLYAIPLRVVIPFKSSFGLVMVLLGSVPEPEDKTSQLAVEESGLDEPELGNPRIDKPMLDKLEAGFDGMPPTNNGSTKDVQPLVVQVETQIPNSKPVVAPIVEPVEAPVSAPKPNLKPSIIYPSRLHDQKLRDKANDQKEKIFQIFQDLNFNISFADAFILMPKFEPTIKSLLTNKEKLFELARTPLNEHCSAVLLKKLPEKLGDLDKFLIPCDFSGMEKYLALVDLDASINLMPLSVWNKLSLLELSPTCMTLELVDRSISRPVGVAEDVLVKVGTFHFSADFVVVNFDADPRVPLILGRSFLKTESSLIDVYEGELTLRVGNKAISFNLDQNSRYSANYDAMSVNRIDLIDVACEEYSQEVIGFSVSGNPTPSTEPIFSTSSPTLTPFGDSDFLLKETDALLAIDDEPISPKINDSYYDSKGEILLEKFLNDDPSSPPLPSQELKVVEPNNKKSSIVEPLPLQLARFLTFGASISWVRSRLHEGTSIYSWSSITCRNGLKRKRSPPTMPELFPNS